jgi:adenylate cyclase
MVGMLGEYSSSVILSSKFVPPQSLIMAHSDLQRLALGRSFQDVNAPGKPMIELMPGRNLSRFLLSRSVPTLPLEHEERRLSLILTAVSGLACLIALCLAFIARRRFLEPLRLLQAGMERIVQGNFTTRLSMPARDEFGTLGDAFNGMTIALEEGRLLGHFVSDSVKRAVRDQAFGEVARRGERRQATILFSGVFGFERIREARSPSGIAKILGQHLEVCSEAVAEAGGEIDKVIGEKILVVFDHQRLGGPHAAWTAAERVVRALRSGMARHGLIPVMGIDAGTVIAGILGSRTVREDYTVIGDPVNLASRLAGLAKKSGGSRVVVSGRALQTSATPVDARRLAIHKVKGKLQEVEAFLLP